MARPGTNTLSISDNEGQFLRYLACRINREIDRFQCGKQDETCTRGHLKLLAERALEVLDDRHELEAWLEATTQVMELPWSFSTSD